MLALAPEIGQTNGSMQAAKSAFSLLLTLPLLARVLLGQGIPVKDPIVLAKCGTCHPADARGIMQYISSARSTPEGWEDVLKRMIRANRVTLTPPEARAIVKYLSLQNGLAPEEAKAVMYYPERRIHDETGVASQRVLDACAKCHSLGRAVSWRRSPGDWKDFVTAHAAQYNLPANQEAIAFLTKAAPLEAPEWAEWNKHTLNPDIAGRWLVTAHVMGHGKFCGEMEVQPGSTSGEFFTRVVLKSVDDGSTLFRTGLVAVYAGYAWRG